MGVGIVITVILLHPKLRPAGGDEVARLEDEVESPGSHSLDSPSVDLDPAVAGDVPPEVFDDAIALAAVRELRSEVGPRQRAGVSWGEQLRVMRRRRLAFDEEFDVAEPAARVGPP